MSTSSILSAPPQPETAAGRILEHVRATNRERASTSTERGPASESPLAAAARPVPSSPFDASRYPEVEVALVACERLGLVSTVSCARDDSGNRDALARWLTYLHWEIKGAIRVLWSRRAERWVGELVSRLETALELVDESRNALCRVRS